MNPTSVPGQRVARKRWPLILLAAPAAVAIWSGWVALGQMCGFGPLHPLPGIVDTFRIDTSITLPIGVEAYSAYALGTWLSATAIPSRARRFAAWSSLGGLILGLVGQVVYHVLVAGHHTTAPIPIVVFVSSLPVLALGAAATLHHLTSEHEARDTSTETPRTVVDTAVDVLPTPEWAGVWLTTGEDTAEGDLDPAPADELSTATIDEVASEVDESAAAVTTQSGGVDVTDLLPVGHAVADQLRDQGVKLTRRVLVEHLRDRGHSCGTDRANELLRQLRAERDDHIGRLEAVAS